MQLIAIDKVLGRTGIKSRVTIWRGVKSGKFPAPVVFGARIFWREADLDAWAESLPSREYQAPILSPSNRGGER